MTVKITYKVDKRIKIVEVSSGSMKFLMKLDDFSEITGVYDFEESSGKMLIDSTVYYEIFKGMIK